MEVLLQHGLCHEFVVDADRKFKPIFTHAMSILNINMHVASGRNHDAIMVERFNNFFNKGLNIFCSERDTTRYFVQGTHMLAYAWNSAPVTETDISCSLIVVGREYQFPLDVIPGDTSIDISPVSTFQYAKDITHQLSKCREIYKVLIDEHRTMHREYINDKNNQQNYRLSH